MSSLATRHREPELMDDPNIDQALHRQALVGLRRVNWISRTAATVWQPIQRLAQQTNGEPLRVLDIACGGGDVSISLAKRAAKSGLPIEVSGCDLSSTALDFARSEADRSAVAVNFFQADVIAAPLPSGYDIVTCSLFLHHLSDDSVVPVLQSMKQAARRMVIVSDLVRSRWGYAMCWCGVRLLTRCRVCHVDGPLSVRAAFTVRELQTLADRAELADATITKRWPQRMLLTWCRP